MANYAGINKNDVVNGEGICVSFFMQGCPHHCSGCFNPETWDPQGGKEFTTETMIEILTAISANGIIRNLSILGGEPLVDYNIELTALIVSTVKMIYPSVKVFIWTGYDMTDLTTASNPFYMNIIFNKADVLITGPFVEEKKDLTLKWRGSSNQEIHYLKI